MLKLCSFGNNPFLCGPGTTKPCPGAPPFSPPPPFLAPGPPSSQGDTGCYSKIFLVYQFHSIVTTKLTCLNLNLSSVKLLEFFFPFLAWIDCLFHFLILPSLKITASELEIEISVSGAPFCVIFLLKPCIVICFTHNTRKC